ncbi:NUDIX hydrolase [Candidatus Gottesmanbacteria bacterium]|nr:NUDIX hydrolase [Candidatus Gottesmanbacteria bacterium]
MITCTFENGKTTSLRHVVVHAIVEKDGAILLGKRAGDILETGKWGLPGGFLDPNETAAQGALRELKEETGWEGEIVSLFRINTNPNRPHEDRQNVALDFLIKPTGKAGEPDHESSEVEWIPFEKLLPFDQFAFDHGQSIGLYLKYRQHPFALPLLE